MHYSFGENMNRLIVASAFIFLFYQGIPNLDAASGSSSQEKFFLQRIVEFWKDGDFRLVKKQINEYLKKNPDSSITDNLQAILGDLFYQEKEYSLALEAYEKISQSDLKGKTITRKCQCLYILGDYDRVVNQLSQLLEKSNYDDLEHREEVLFILGDSLFRKVESLEESKEKSGLASKTYSLLKCVKGESYREKILLPLALTAQMIGEHEESIALFRELLEKKEEQRQEILMHIAAVQTEFDMDQAISTYQQIVSLKTSLSGIAAYNEMVLLYQKERYLDLIERYPLLSEQFSAEQQPLLTFFVGQSCFKTSQYETAFKYLQPIVDNQSIQMEYKRAALLMIAKSLHKLEKKSLLDQTVKQFISLFPDDSEQENMLLMHAQAALQFGYIEEATLDLSQILSSCRKKELEESILYDLGKLLSQLNRWNEARSSFASLLEKFPETQFYSTWPLLVTCSLEELKEAPLENISQKKRQLVGDLQQAFLHIDSSPWNHNEKGSYQLLLAQLLFDLSQYTESLKELVSFFGSYSDHPDFEEGLLMQLELQEKLNRTPREIVDLAEKELKRIERDENILKTRIILFNNYSVLKEHDHAAEHLYQAYLKKNSSIDQDHKIWLAHYYSNKGGDSNLEYKKKAEAIFTDILEIDEKNFLHFNPQHTYLESEVFKYAELAPPLVKKELFLSLIKLYSDYPELPWKLCEQASLELGIALISLGEAEQALHTFDHLITQLEDSSYYTYAALLQKSKALFALYKETPNTNYSLDEILSTLKDLQIKKEFDYEPLFIEAALLYADIRSTTASSDKRIDDALFFLNRIKEDFNSREDLIHQKYHEDRSQDFEKNQLFLTYMKCIQAEIYWLESQRAHISKNSEQADYFADLARLLFDEVLNAPQTTTYLRNRAISNITIVELHK